MSTQQLTNCAKRMIAMINREIEDPALRDKKIKDAKKLSYQTTNKRK